MIGERHEFGTIVFTRTQGVNGDFWLLTSKEYNLPFGEIFAYYPDHTMLAIRRLLSMYNIPGMGVFHLDGAMIADIARFFYLLEQGEVK